MSSFMCRGLRVGFYVSSFMCQVGVLWVSSGCFMCQVGFMCRVLCGIYVSSVGFMCRVQVLCVEWVFYVSSGFDVLSFMCLTQ